MKQLHEVIEVPGKREEVFRFTSDFSRIGQWDPGVTASEKLTPGPIVEGSRFKVVVKAGLGTAEMIYTVLRHEPPQRVVLEGVGEKVHALDDIRFSETDSGTQIDYTARISLGGLAGKAEFLLGNALERMGRKAMDGLRKALTPGAQPPSESPRRNLADRLVLPGALGFTRFGYAHRKKSWRPISERLEGRTAVVTGATSGLGRVVAAELAALGARVVLVGRSREKLDRALAEIQEESGNFDVAAEQADLSLMSEVRALAGRLLEREKAIHILVNNAAVLPAEKTMTAEGLETAFATNLLSPWLLTRLLIPRLEASAPARIVNVSSGGMYLSGLDVDELLDPSDPYDGSRAYARAKRGLMVLTEAWAEELADSGVVVNAMHPGWADTPGVQDSLPAFHRLTRPVLRTPEQGADTIVWLAAATEAGQVSGKFWLDREPHLAAIFPGTAGSEPQRQRLIDELTRLVA
jgi:NAD(P)-dependent dehydrogenase (short-subunit alcohol dehydrogenase family)/carbon monoxide dehydrogenase subunit G